MSQIQITIEDRRVSERRVGADRRAAVVVEAPVETPVEPEVAA